MYLLQVQCLSLNKLFKIIKSVNRQQGLACKAIEFYIVCNVYHGPKIGGKLNKLKRSAFYLEVLFFTFMEPLDFDSQLRIIDTNQYDKPNEYKPNYPSEYNQIPRGFPLSKRFLEILNDSIE